ncbi:hypothetical protein VIGAN_04263800 [Vigna angularis var. angularis]|uniref:Uncharacterized protein n=1 Tax=Vigna angularis var. angularis TaxID=157739 RepID=A0A0S3RX13_PHAAN|nr:hypothetical protein VIGAN_04263800 [Vigna angularis var. angularis]
MLCCVAWCGGTNHLHLFTTTQYYRVCMCVAERYLHQCCLHSSSLTTLTSLPLYQDQVSLIPFALISHTKHVTPFFHIFFLFFSLSGFRLFAVIFYRPHSPNCS